MISDIFNLLPTLSTVTTSLVALFTTHVCLSDCPLHHPLQYNGFKKLIKCFWIHLEAVCDVFCGHFSLKKVQEWLVLDKNKSGVAQNRPEASF